MCTAAAYRTQSLYFGRNLDYERSYGESVAVMPRRYPLSFRHMPPSPTHYAMLGMAHVQDGFPLYYDAMNEKGLCIAGLNFVGNAVYAKAEAGKPAVAQFELIPWLLAHCADVAQARAALQGISITDTPFCEGLPAAQLHWLISDGRESLVLEATAEGLQLYDNPFDVLTNNPPFPMQRFALNAYAALSPKQPENRFLPGVELERYSRGMGALGLPGDLSSQSRFIRAAFVRAHSRSSAEEAGGVHQLLHILGAVSQPRGCCELDDGSFEYTLYSCCCSAKTGTYYYRTYENSTLTAVCLFSEDLDRDTLVCYPLRTEMQVYREHEQTLASVGSM